MADSPELAHGLSIAQLLAAVENELIPRLMVSHADETRAAETDAEPALPERGAWAAHSEVAAFAAWCAAGDDRRMAEHVSGLLARNVGLDAIYLHLLAPVARHLGEQWVRDEVGFVEVQLGLCQLHRLVRDCGSVGLEVGSPLGGGDGGTRSIMLGVAPGEMHTFGVTLAAEFFRRHGWQVSNLCGLDIDFLLERVATTHYTAAGFSLHGDGCFDALVETIGAIRERSCNASLLVLVGGDYFARHPDKVDVVGADLGADDAHRAVFAAERALHGVLGAVET